MGDRRVALVAGASGYVGPALARLLAERGHDLVLGDPGPLTDELVAGGAAVEVVEDVRELAGEGAAERLVAAGLARFGRIDAAVAASGRIVVGRFLESSIDDLRAVTTGCLEAPYRFLRAVVPVMVEQGDGQVWSSPARRRPGPRPGRRSTRRLGPGPRCSCATWPARWPAPACR